MKHNIFSKALLIAPQQGWHSARAAQRTSTAYQRQDCHWQRTQK